MKITLMMAVTADGLIAKNSNHFPDWTSPEDKSLFQKISKEYGVMIFGESTFNTFPAPLPGRLNVVFTLEKNPKPQEGVKWVTGDIGAVLKELEAEGHNKALLGGGAYLNSLFLEKNLIDEIILTIEPLIFGKGLGVFSKDLDAKLELLETRKLNANSIMLHYKVL
ncbi:dihydrofolate reductase [Candidatus Parcubacteria bacterium]|nr:dihydrofolate reductase [Candidatus Parcubacteria bacterium]